MLGIGILSSPGLTAAARILGDGFLFKGGAKTDPD